MLAAIREASPQALHHFTQADQVNQLVGASEADPDLGFMARLLALCALPRAPTPATGFFTNASQTRQRPVPALHAGRAGKQAPLRLGASLSEFMREVGYLRHQRRKPGRADTASQPDEVDNFGG